MKSTQKQPGSAPVVLVTGAASGIGKACALRFAANGYRVALADLDAARLNTVSAAVAGLGAEALSLPLDISDERACHDAASRILASWRRIDALVANAGVQTGGSLLETSAADWQRILDVNLSGTAWSAKAVLPAMVQQGSGAIVIVSSVNAIIGSAGMAAYDMSKAAVLALTRNLATEYGSRGIRVNAVCPGNTLTDFHLDKLVRQGISAAQVREMTRGYGLLGRIAEPDEIASAIAFLCGDGASFITGQALVVDGGYSITGRARS